MTTMTLSVPIELKTRMEDHPEMNWSEVARRAFRQKLEDLEMLREITSKSKLTEKDALELGKELNRKLAQRHSGK